MVRDVVIAALKMLGMDNLSAELENESGELTATGEKFLNYYNLVISEIAEEYRRNDYESTPVASSLNDETAAFTGISPRVIAYGIAAEYCIVEGLEESVTWDTRYKSALSLGRRPSVRIKARRCY